MEDKVYTVEVTMTVKKTYKVKASSDDEATQKLIDSGLVVVSHEDDRPEEYNEDYEVLGISQDEADVDVE